ncbi:hypothetical protein D3C71_1559480 [compost metagenome]
MPASGVAVAVLISDVPVKSEAIIPVTLIVTVPDPEGIAAKILILLVAPVAVPLMTAPF